MISYLHTIRYMSNFARIPRTMRHNPQFPLDNRPGFGLHSIYNTAGAGRQTGRRYAKKRNSTWREFGRERTAGESPWRSAVEPALEHRMSKYGVVRR